MTTGDDSSGLPRLLLLSRTPPGDANVGQLFLRDLCISYPHDRLAFGIVQHESQEADHHLFPDVPKLHLTRGAARRFHRGPLAVTTVLSHLSFRRHMRRGDRSVIQDFVRFGRQHRVDKVWAVLNSPLLFRIAPRVAEALHVPLVVMIWDPPEGVGLLFGLDALSRALATKHFGAAMAHAERCAVISERMDVEYRARYGTDNVLVRHGIASSEARRTRERDESELRIGFCGTLYAEREWQALLTALEQLEWMAEGKPIRLIVAGPRIPPLTSRTPARIDYLGWRNLSDTLDLMAGCHFAYFPYWLDSTYAQSARLCFASKLTTYLTAGLPVLYHGPRDAAVVEFLTRFPAAECCHSVDPAAVARAILALAASERRERLATAARLAVSEELNVTIFRRRFHQLIGTRRLESA